MMARLLNLMRERRRLFLVLLLLGLTMVPLLWVGVKLARSPHSSIWSGVYFQELLSGRYQGAQETTDLFFVMCDHWEPGKGEPAIARSMDWLERYQKVALEHQDSSGRPFQYTWYYPVDNMEPRILQLLAQEAARGWGEIEVHWHHNHDSSAVFETQLVDALQQFTAVGALISEPGAQPRWSFIHGNWALDGSSPRQCGIDDEISILQRQGCYADFTFPALEATGQPEVINRIFYAQDTPQPKSHNTGLEAKVGQVGEGLMIFQGPLGMDFKNPLLLIEGAAIDAAEGTGLVGRLRPPSGPREYFKPSRVALWDNLHVSIEGKPEYCFVKVHAHGHEDADILLDGQLDAMLDELQEYCSQRDIRLHYLTAREAYNVVRALEKGLDGDPAQYYDHEIKAPMNRQAPVMRAAPTQGES